MLRLILPQPRQEMLVLQHKQPSRPFVSSKCTSHKLCIHNSTSWFEEGMHPDVKVP